MDDRIKELFDRIKGAASTVGSAAYSGAKEAGKFAGDTIEIAKLNMKVFDLKAENESSLKKLGEQIYSAHCGKETSDSIVDTLIAEIDMRNEEIAGLKEKIAELKKTVKCPDCGEICGKSDAFCKRCGHQF